MIRDENKVSKEYKNRVMVAEQNLSLFTNSATNCDIPMMLENSAMFLETIKNANNLYFNMPPEVQNLSKNTFSNLHNIVQKYFAIRANIRNACKCKTV